MPHSSSKNLQSQSSNFRDKIWGFRVRIVLLLNIRGSASFNFWSNSNHLGSLLFGSCNLTFLSRSNVGNAFESRLECWFGEEAWHSLDSKRSILSLSFDSPILLENHISGQWLWTGTEASCDLSIQGFCTVLSNTFEDVLFSVFAVLLSLVPLL